MQRNKDFYRSISNICGYYWVGYWDNFHHFVKQIGNKYAEIRVTDTDINNGNLNFMAKKDLTR